MRHKEFDIFHEIAMPPFLGRTESSAYADAFREFMKLGINLTLLENFGMAVVGTSAECIEQLRKYEAAGVTHMLCAVGAGAVKTEVAPESAASPQR